MRLFQQRTVLNAVDNPSPVPPPPPPFLPDQEEERRLSLLRESTTHLREGRHRLPTPDRVAIMDLSSSFQKRRLGKQQQILSEITQRCREQEVTDLSTKISSKMQPKKSEDDDDPSSMYQAVSRMPHFRPRPRQVHGSFSGDLKDLDSIERRVKSEKGYKFFPARKIMRRQPTRLQLITTTVKAGGGVGRGGGGAGGGGGGGGSTYREPPGTTSTYMGGGSRFSIDFLKGVRPTDPDMRAQILERQSINGSIQLQHYIQPKMDAMAPLLLPDLHGVDGFAEGGAAGGGAGGGYQDRLDSYFTSSRLPLNQRSRSFYDASSISGRSFRSMYTGHRPTGSRHHLQSKRSERPAVGASHVLPEAEMDNDDGDGMGRVGGMSGGGGAGEVPMSLKGSGSAVLRAESQKVSC